MTSIVYFILVKEEILQLQWNWRFYMRYIQTNHLAALPHFSHYSHLAGQQRHYTSSTTLCRNITPLL